jgi:transcriptional regulator with XRE-family HTH domain
MTDLRISPIQRKLGQRIRERRLDLKMTQAQLADKTGLDRTYISGLESGRRNPALRNLNKLANSLKISIDQLMKFD